MYGSLRVEYQRFLRHGSPAQLKVRLGEGPAGEARLWVEREYLDTFHVKEVRPTPVRAETTSGWLVLTFRRDAGAAVSVVFFLEPRRPGRCAGRLGADGGEVAVSHFIYP